MPQPAYVEGDLLVTLHADADPAAVEDALRATLEAVEPGARLKRIGSSRVFLVKVDEARVPAIHDRLTRLDTVQAVERNRVVHALGSDREGGAGGAASFS